MISALCVCAHAFFCKDLIFLALLVFVGFQPFSVIFFLLAI